MTTQRFVHKFAKRLAVLATLGMALSLAGSASAQTIYTMTADPNGGLIRSNGVTETGGVTRLIGSSATANQGLSNIYFFELPALGPGEVITDAVLDFNYASLDTTGGPVSFNADLYGLGHVDAPPGMDGNWFFEGPAQDTRTRDSLGTGSIASGAVSLIEDDILTTATTTGRVATSNTTALIDFIDSLYDDGAEAGDFAVFHFVADEIVSTLSGARGFRITHSGGDPADFAFLQITTQQIQQVPEPASLLLWGLLGGAMAAGVVWKRRKNPSR